MTGESPYPRIGRSITPRHRRITVFTTCIRTLLEAATAREGLSDCSWAISSRSAGYCIDVSHQFNDERFLLGRGVLRSLRVRRVRCAPRFEHDGCLDVNEVYTKSNRSLERKHHTFFPTTATGISEMAPLLGDSRNWPDASSLVNVKIPV